MEIVDREDRSGKNMVQVAVSETGAEAAMIRGLLENESIRTLVRPPIDGRVPPRGACRIWVRPDDAIAARKLLGEAIVEDPADVEIPESVNADYLADAAGYASRDGNVIGGHGRALIIVAAFVVAALLVFALLH